MRSPFNKLTTVLVVTVILFSFSSMLVHDLFTLGKAFGSNMEDPRWNDNANFGEPWNIIEFSDLGMLAPHYGEHYT